MSKNKEIKTNAMRILDRMKIPYSHYTYECEEFTDGVQVADMLGLPHEKVYKTLVAQGASREYFVFVIPIEAELDLKKAARAVGEKSVSMIHVKDITSVTGYVRGGCSPLGMKKQFPTVIHSDALKFDRVWISGGRIGTSICLDPQDLIRVTRAKTADFSVAES